MNFPFTQPFLLHIRGNGFMIRPWIYAMSLQWCWNQRAKNTHVLLHGRYIASVNLSMRQALRIFLGGWQQTEAACIQIFSFSDNANIKKAQMKHWLCISFTWLIWIFAFTDNSLTFPAARTDGKRGIRHPPSASLLTVLLIKILIQYWLKFDGRDPVLKHSNCLAWICALKLRTMSVMCHVQQLGHHRTRAGKWKGELLYMVTA